MHDLLLFPTKLILCFECHEDTDSFFLGFENYSALSTRLSPCLNLLCLCSASCCGNSWAFCVVPRVVYRKMPLACGGILADMLP
jgi:hypothetical protein